MPLISNQQANEQYNKCNVRWHKENIMKIGTIIVDHPFVVVLQRLQYITITAMCGLID